MLNTLTPPPKSLSAWLQASRAHYLNFLRNLTPQVLLATLMWRIGAQLDFSRFDLSNTVQTVGFYVFLALFGFAVYANTSLFLADLFPGLMPWIRSTEDALRASSKSGRKLPFVLAHATLRERGFEVFLAMSALVLLQFIFAGVLASSIVSAFNGGP